MLMSEGVLPSNEGRGYVLRRLIRRALIQVNKIKPNQLILNKLVACFVNKYSSSYFDLNEKASFVQKNLKIEEEKFMETIEVGLTLLNKEIINLGANNFPPETAFKLYDTYGFPIDVTKNILKEKKINLDLKKYDQIVLDVKNKQKNSWKGSGDKIKDPIFLDLKQTFKSTTFLGYEKKSIRAKLLCIIHKDKIVKKIEKNEKDFFLIFDKTPFYAESGGQVGDQGIILSIDGDLVANICDTQKIDGDIFLHRVEKNKILMSTDDEFTISIDEERRNIIRNNHSATHLLNSSLREVLGDHISQKGSLVNEEKLRFDFTYSEQITDSQIEKIEQLVNLTIRADLRSNINSCLRRRQCKVVQLLFLAKGIQKMLESFHLKTKKMTMYYPRWNFVEGHTSSPLVKLECLKSFQIIQYPQVLKGLRRLREKRQKFYFLQN